MEKVEFKIRDLNYRMECLPFEKARPLWFDMQKKLGNSIAAAGSSANAEAAFIAGLATEIDEALAKKATEAFGPYTWYEDDGRFPCLTTDPMHWTKKGVDGMGDWMEFIVFGVKLNYAPFLERAAKQFRELKAKGP